MKSNYTTKATYLYQNWYGSYHIKYIQVWTPFKAVHVRYKKAVQTEIYLWLLWYISSLCGIHMPLSSLVSTFLNGCHQLRFLDIKVWLNEDVKTNHIFPFVIVSAEKYQCHDDICCYISKCFPVVWVIYCSFIWNTYLRGMHTTESKRKNTCNIVVRLYITS